MWSLVRRGACVAGDDGGDVLLAMVIAGLRLMLVTVWRADPDNGDGDRVN